jgi:glyoxylase-like metal-dependent hydrolase (beta-lactamase superfamily II)
MDPSRPRLLLIAATAALLASCASPGGGNAADVLARAAQAMGADRLDTLRYTAEGTGWTFGQAYQPGTAWPKITIHSLTRTIDYRAGAMRDEIVLSRAEPRGGGGYPLQGQQRNDQYIAGDIAWNVAGTNVTAGPRFVNDRTHQLWITPHGVLKAAQRHNATPARTEGGSALAFVQPGRYAATVHLGADHLVTRVESTAPDPVMGDTRTVTTYSDYRDVGNGVRFPMRVQQTMGGHPVLELAIKDVQPNSTLAIAVPDAARNQGENVTADAVAPGVWHLAGGSHNSVAIEMADHFILVETPLNDARTQAVIDRVKQLAPGKPIRTAVNSHSHFDHAGGVRTAVAEGATIVTGAANVPYFQRVLAQTNAVRPDALARAAKAPSLRGVADKLDIGDATRPVEVHAITGGNHAEGFVMVYLPRERLLIQADAFTPPPPNTAPPATANANNVNLVDNIERLRLAVDRILPLHGRVVPLSELYAQTGRTPPAR